MLSSYRDEVLNCLQSVSTEVLDLAIEQIQNASKRNANIFIAGNGGSAALASHFTIDLIKSGFTRKNPIRAFSLVDNSPVVTATGNDFDFDEVFSWQLRELGNENDLLIVISSSGNSNNILNALKTSREKNMYSLSISGFDGGMVSRISNVSIVTKSEKGNYGPVEDSHSIICHYLARQVLKFN